MNIWAEEIAVWHDLQYDVANNKNRKKQVP